MLRRFFDPFAGLVFNEDDGTGSGDEPVAPPVEPGPAPWADDLAAYFEDEAARTRADSFLREKIQPRMTTLETQYAETEDARTLYGDLVEDPAATFLALATELFGEDQAEAMAAMLADEDKEAPDDSPPATTPPATTPVVEEDPVLAEMREDYVSRTQREAFESELARVQGDPDNEDIKDYITREHLAPFIVASGGDFDDAMLAYRTWLDQFWEDEEDETPAVAAPPVLSDGTTPPATQKRYTDMSEALDDTMEEMREKRNAPTPVGTV